MANMNRHRLLDPPLVPRNGHTLKILLACRVSDPKPGKQDERSLDDQEAEHREWVHAHTDCPVECEVIAGSGSGESLERKEYFRLIELIETEEYDALLTEDLGRIVRRIQAHFVCELCVDHNVRLIAHNDHIDTAQSGWEDRSIFSAWHHERSNRDTSERIKRTHRNRFTHGGCLALPIFGYEKKPGSKSDHDLQRIDKYHSVYREWFRKLDEEESSWAEIADWLNNLEIPTGPYCRSDKWTGPMVRRVTNNPILKGERFRNKRRTRRNNQSGQYRSEKAPPEVLLTRRVPHLAFFDEGYYDQVVKNANERNNKFGRGRKTNRDPLAGRPRKRTRFPGQLIECGVCGRGYVFGGHGQTDHLMCSGAREYRCWNGVTVDGPLSARIVLDAVLEEIMSWQGFDEAFATKFEQKARAATDDLSEKISHQEGKLNTIQRQIDNLVDILSQGTGSQTLVRRINELESDKTTVGWELKKLRQKPRERIEIPTAQVLRDLAKKSLGNQDINGFEFARVMRQLIPKIIVRPYRSCDGGKIVLRGEFDLEIANLLPDQKSCNHIADPLKRQLVVDFSDLPQRIAYRKQVVTMRKTINPQTGRVFTQNEVAENLGITSTAVQRAAALQRRMDQLGISDPLQLVTSPPDDDGKLKRHHHSRYRFEPIHSTNTHQ